MDTTRRGGVLEHSSASGSGVRRRRRLAARRDRAERGAPAARARRPPRCRVRARRVAVCDARTCAAHGARSRRSSSHAGHDDAARRVLTALGAGDRADEGILHGNAEARAFEQTPACVAQMTALLGAHIDRRLPRLRRRRRRRRGVDGGRTCARRARGVGVGDARARRRVRGARAAVGPLSRRGGRGANVTRSFLNSRKLGRKCNS